MAQAWGESDWDAHDGYEEYWWGLSRSEQLLVIEQLNQAQLAAEAGEAAAYRGEASPAERQLLRAISEFLEFQALDLRDKLILLSTSTGSDRKALESFQPCWERISDSEKSRFMQLLSEPHIVSGVKLDLSKLNALC